MNLTSPETARMRSRHARTLILWTVLAGTLAFGLAALGAPATTAINAIGPKDILQHLNRMISWYQHVNGVNQATSSPQNILLQDNTRAASRKVLVQAFDFARAEAVLLQNDKQSVGSTTGTSAPQNRSLQQAANNTAQRIAQLQSQIQTLNEEILRARTRKDRQRFQNQRIALTANLNLQKQIQTTIQKIASYATGAGAGAGASGLLGQINDLANSDSIPSALNGSETASGGAPANKTAAQVYHPETSGILDLLTKTVGFTQDRVQLKSLITETGERLDDVNALKKPLILKLRGFVQQSETIATAMASQTDPAQVESLRTQLNAIPAQFKEISAVLTPLSEEGIIIGTARNSLEEWHSSLSQQLKSTWHYLLLRLVLLGIAIGAILLASRLARSAILRYVHDTRRRRQFLLLRRFAVGLALAIVVLVAFVTSFSSIATVAGFITAGLAVALQNVILSIVAYFFIIGRYGFRVGDRVTIANVNGEIIDIGLIRLYLMEMAGAGVDLHSTGRVVLFTNSVVFQNQPVYKQAPGTEYTWHAVSTTLTADTDYDQARKRLTAAVDAVYDEYRSVIESQHETFERTISLQLATPSPQTRMRYTDTGLEVLIRYPVEIQTAAAVDERIITGLLKETEKSPPLQLAPTGRPRIQPAS